VTVTCNVLLSSAGRRVALLRAFERDLDHLGVDGAVAAVDASPLTAAGHLASWLEPIPSVGDPTYVDALLDVCHRHEVRVLVPTIDPELPVLAALAGRLRAVGVHPLVSGPATTAIAGDKWRTHRHLVDAGIPTPAQWRPDEARAAADDLPYPLIAKPVAGSASVGLVRLDDAAALHRNTELDDGYLVQRCVRGREHTVDIWVGRDGEVWDAVARERLEVRGGEVSKGVTRRDGAVLEAATAVAESLPDAYGPLTIQVFRDGTDVHVIEVNARFGGGFPLAWEAGAHFPRWAITDALDLDPAPRPWPWVADLVMLRFDEAVFLPSAEVEW
jgi:carbamoyl-phosphate synthase large subunit